MRCSFCERTAEYTCICQFAIFCPIHQSQHITSSDDSHSLEKLDILLSSEESQKLKKEVLIKILDLEKSKKNILSISQSMVKKIEICSKKAIQKLDFQTQILLKLINLKYLSKSLKTEANKVATNILKIKKLSDLSIEPLIEKAFLQEFIFEPKEKIYQIKKLGSEFLDKQNKEIEQTKVIVTGGQVKKEPEQNIKKRFTVNKLNKVTLDKRIENRKKYQVLNSKVVCEKLEYLDHIGIYEFLGIFGKGEPLRYKIREIYFSIDGKYSFICKTYAGKFKKITV